MIIHGMGEQRPMETLREVVEAVLPKPKPGKPKYWSKPDSTSDLFELRKLQARVGRHKTHFYEYYWAHLVQGTNYWHIWHWLKNLLFRWPWNVPKRLFMVWTVTWVLLTVFAAVSAHGVLDFMDRPLIEGIENFFAGNWNYPLALLLFLIAQYFLINYVGDAARYLSPHPKNIELRQKIRKGGIDLLRRLHESSEKI